MNNIIFEKVSPQHPDKVADRIAGAILDLANKYNKNFIAAVEVLLGHNNCVIINETNTTLTNAEVTNIVNRIAGHIDNINYIEVAQDIHLADNQKELSCGDNGIFTGVVTDPAEIYLTELTKYFYKVFNADGKYIIDTNKQLITICQSNATNDEILEHLRIFNKDKNLYFKLFKVLVNPLGQWSGGINVDAGATNRKLGSDMGRSVTGGGLHGKDPSKADLTLNLWLNLYANKKGKNLSTSCSIGDKYVYIDNKEYEYKFIVNEVKEYIENIGGYEKFAEYGLLR